MLIIPSMKDFDSYGLRFLKEHAICEDASQGMLQKGALQP